MATLFINAHPQLSIVLTRPHVLHSGVLDTALHYVQLMVHKPVVDVEGSNATHAATVALNLTAATAQQQCSAAKQRQKSRFNAGAVGSRTNSLPLASH